MVVSKKGYTLAEIASLFRKEGIVESDIMIRYLRDGNLTACIYFPSFRKSPISIPEGYWEEEEEADYLGEIHKLFSRNPHSAEAYKVSPGFAVEDQKTRLMTVADSIVRKDLSSIDPAYKRVLKELKLYKKSMSEDDWVCLMAQFSEWHLKLEEESETDFLPFVHSDEWREFMREFGDPSPRALGKAGTRKRVKEWEFVFREIVVMLLDGQNPKSANAVAKELSDKDALRGKLRQDTIQRELRDFEKENGVSFGDSEKQ